MGKRKGPSGLSRFLAALQPEPLPKSTKVAPSPAQVSEKTQQGGPPLKKRKLENPVSRTDDPDWIPAYDATGLVPQYTDASQVPEHLQKYYNQCTRYFSLYWTPPGCLLDEEGWYSVTPELIANQIAERCRCDTILDAFCGVGGNAIAFAQTCQRVIALDISPKRLALARHNAQIYGVADRIEFILADYISFARSYLTRPSTNAKKIDVIFLSPPWGGPAYISGGTLTPEGDRPSSPSKEPNSSLYSLSSIQPIHGAELFHLSRRITPNIAYYLPRNTNLEEIGTLLDPNPSFMKAPEDSSNKKEGRDSPSSERNDAIVSEYVEVEEEWMGSKLKALTCYFGGLPDGQGHLY